MDQESRQDYGGVIDHLTAIIAEARVARGILAPYESTASDMPDAAVSLVASDDRVWEARMGVRKATLGLEAAGLDFEHRAAIETAYEALLAVSLEVMWGLGD